MTATRQPRQTRRSDEWSTPQALFDSLDQEFHFDLDVCATQENAKCASFFSLEVDGLRRQWSGVCWMNPPYGQQIRRWVRKAYEASLAGSTVVCLLPASTDTGWFHAYCLRGEVRFLQGRLRFSERGRAPFGSMIVIFRPSQPPLDVVD